MNGQKRVAVTCFLAVESLLYLLFTVLDLLIADSNTTALKFLAILGCFAFSLYLSIQGGDRLVTAALFFTVCADVFLLLLDAYYAAGVLLFCVVQALYLCRIYPHNGKRSLWGLRLLLFGIAILGLYLLQMLDFLNLLALFYFTNFFCNVICSFYGKGISFRLFSVGLVLFLCCDICVGAFQNVEIFPNWMAEFSTIGMWLFYLPAQVLITLSGITNEIRGDRL